MYVYIIYINGKTFSKYNLPRQKFKTKNTKTTFCLKAAIFRYVR